MITVYHVTAGKYDYDGEDCKYAASFFTEDEAINALESVSDYPWSHMTKATYKLEKWEIIK